MVDLAPLQRSRTPSTPKLRTLRSSDNYQKENSLNDFSSPKRRSLRLFHKDNSSPEQHTVIKSIYGRSKQIERPPTEALKQMNHSSKTLSRKKKESSVQKSSIPTKSFYSGQKTLTPNHGNILKDIQKSPKVRVSTSPKNKRRSSPPFMNRGVHHKVKKRLGRATNSGSHHLPPMDLEIILGNIRNEKLLNLITNKRKERQQIEKVHTILRSSQNPIAMARPLRALSVGNDDSDSNNNGKKLELNKSRSTDDLYNLDFSDIDSCSDNEIGSTGLRGSSLSLNNIDDIMQYSPIKERQEDELQNTKRKFFKSGRVTNVPKEVQITDHIKASVCNGRISLIEEKQRPHRRIKVKSTDAFSIEQAEVDAILKNLDDSVFNNANEEQPKASDFDTVTDSSEPFLEDNLMDIQLLEDFSEFRNRLPFNTTDPELIEQQHLLLDFLITNNICNEETFNIFIADPDNHKEEAAKIVDQVVLVVNELTDEYRKRLPYNTTDPYIIERQQNFLEFLIEHNLCTEENFDIFIVNYEKRYQEADAIIASIENASDTVNPIGSNNINDDAKTIVENIDQGNKLAIDFNKQTTLVTNALQEQNTNNASNIAAVGQEKQRMFPIFNNEKYQRLPQQSSRPKERIFNAGYGLNQYQIDAGQKQFGAKQCKQCGLVYTMHEPEEERLHRDFHSSLHVLRFNGWIDEDLVAIFPEWGRDGRIIRITETSHINRRSRLMEIVKIVDKELGFSSYIIPQIFVAYLAVRNRQIVGLCLVQPLKHANKYICVDGVDCCTREEFEAKCGISRVWVSPLERRIGIASKLFRIVRTNTIQREEIPVDKIAFTSPTQDGKVFAQKVTGLENFLVYQ